MNIAPLEIDAVLMRQPGIEEAAVVGVPDPIYGEEIAAFVVARKDAAPDPESIVSGCARDLPAFKLPRSVIFVDRLPKSGRGKIRREALKEMWRARDGGDSRGEAKELEPAAPNPAQWRPVASGTGKRKA